MTRRISRTICKLLLLLGGKTIWTQRTVNAFSSSTSTSSRPPLKIVFVTGNAMKAREVQTIVSQYCYQDDDSNCQLLSLDLSLLDVDLPEIQEVDTMAIAKQKCLLAAQLADGPCLVEDTSLCFTSLGGMPGPYIKWFSNTLNNTGLYNILAAYPDKSATAICTLAFSPSKYADPILFTGVCHGTIVAPEPGRGFGWDSIFLPRSASVPFSQMNTLEKCELSHRGNAVRKFADWLGRNHDNLLERLENPNVLGHQGLTFRMRPQDNGDDGKNEKDTDASS